VLALGEGIVGRVRASGEPVMLADVTEAPDARGCALAVSSPPPWPR
jgi:signal transduction protein with GAF and PtsI domain